MKRKVSVKLHSYCAKYLSKKISSQCFLPCHPSAQTLGSIVPFWIRVSCAEMTPY
ncbi:MAG: hypothetical protein O7161_05215 [Wolbachia endosymbiont of Halictus tumulorum]|nr:hypothetical protein [Wolbachia endosymbiont of Halictus tumulorum]